MKTPKEFDADEARKLLEYLELGLEDGERLAGGEHAILRAFGKIRQDERQRCLSAAAIEKAFGR